MSIVNEIPSVNYHLWKACNMRCKFCFATFQDIEPQFLPKGHLGREDCILVVESLSGAGFQKINFAGGEPTLCPWLPDLIPAGEGVRTHHIGGDQWEPDYRGMAGERQRKPRLDCVEH